MLEKLEELKKLGAYRIVITYGEGSGCDDSSEPMMERRIRVVCEPVGYLGSMRAMYRGTVQSLLDFDFKSESKLISNPPKEDEYKEDGLYCWGSEGSVESYQRDGKLFPFG